MSPGKDETHVCGYVYIIYYIIYNILPLLFKNFLDPPPSSGGNQNLLLPLLKRRVSELSELSGQNQDNGKQTYYQLPP